MGRFWRLGHTARAQHCWLASRFVAVSRGREPWDAAKIVDDDRTVPAPTPASGRSSLTMPSCQASSN